MTEWKFLTNHAHVLACITADPTTRLRDMAVEVDLTERAVHRILSELIEAGYVSRKRHGARNHYEVHLDLPLRYPGEKRAVGDLLVLLVSNEGASEATADRLNGKKRSRKARARQS
jgi:winged helix-turn-helix DNA-binding protein